MMLFFFLFSPVLFAELGVWTAFFFLPVFTLDGKLNNSGSLFMYYFSDMHHMHPLDGKDNAEVGYCLKIPSRNAHTYLIMYFFPSM